MICRGISITTACGKFPDAPPLTLNCMGSFDFKTIRERMAFGAQDDSTQQNEDMKSAIQVRKEHKAVCAKMDELMREGDGQPLPQNEELYFRLYSMRLVLEWVHPSLIKTSGKGAERRVELMVH